MADAIKSLAAGPPRLAPEAWLALKDRALDVAAEGISIADARLPDRPLIYVNEGFERMTGYTRAEVLGRNCRFLQGPGTSADAVAEIRAALSQRRECVVEILNYRKDGSPFWNRLSISPVRDGGGALTHFIGIQSDVTARRLAEERLRQAKEGLERSLKLAAQVQQALLPPPEVSVGEIRCAHLFHPCDDLAGDGVGVVHLPDGRIGLFVLDVSGHGVGSALLSFTLNHLLAPTADGILVGTGSGAEAAIVPPARVAERLNRQFPMERTRQYFTIVYGVIHPGSGRLEYTVGGHPAPLLLPTAGPPVPLRGADLPIGMLERASYTQQSVTLAPGERLYLYTDGAVEASNGAGDEFGQERLRAAVERWRDRPLRDSLDRIAAEVQAWCGGRLIDDLTLLALERAG